MQHVLLLHIVLCTSRVKDVILTMPFCPGLAKNFGSEFQSPLVLHEDFRLCMFDISGICKIMASREATVVEKATVVEEVGGHASGSATRDGCSHGGARQGSG